MKGVSVSDFGPLPLTTADTSRFSRRIELVGRKLSEPRGDVAGKNWRRPAACQT
jgi:hypothetical protein